MEVSGWLRDPFVVSVLVVRLNLIIGYFDVVEGGDGVCVGP